MIDEHTEEQASLYVLGLLPPDELPQFKTAMAAEPELAEIVSRLETGAAAFGTLAPPRDPPPALRGRLMQQIRGETPAERVAPFSQRYAWLPWAAAACLAVLAGRFAYERYQLGLLNYAFLLRDQAQQRELDNVQGREAALQRRLNDALARIATSGKEEADLQAQLADLRTRDALSQIKIAALASMLKGAPQAMAVVAWDGNAQRGIVKTLNVPAPGADKDYQLWIIDPGYKQPVSAGVLDPAAGTNFQPLHPIAKADKFAVSLEKKGGAPEPQGPIVLVGGL